MKKDLDVNEIIKLYKNGLSCAKIGKKFNTTHNTISSLLKKEGIEVVIQPNKYILDEKSIVDLYKNGDSLTNIAKKFNVSRKVITRIIKNNNIEITNLYNSKHKYNEDYFNKIDCEEKAYWLGFLYADGNVIYNKKYAVDIGLSETDILHLKKLKYQLCSTSKITCRNIKLNDKFHRSCRLIIHNKKIVEDLINLGCVPNKSLILKFPNNNQVPYKFLRHFIRGYFDGDGSVYLNKSKRNYSLCVNFIGTYDFLNELNNYFIENLDNYTKTNIYKKENGNSYFILKTRNQATSILDFLYNDSSIFLERKFNKYINLKQMTCRPKPTLQET